MSSRIIITIVVVILTRPSRQGAISPPHLTWRPRPIHIEGAVCSAPLSVPYGLHSTLCTHVEGPILKMQNVLYFDQTMVSSLAKGTIHIKDAVCSAPQYTVSTMSCSGARQYSMCPPSIEQGRSRRMSGGALIALITNLFRAPSGSTHQPSSLSCKAPYTYFRSQYLVSEDQKNGGGGGW